MPEKPLTTSALILRLFWEERLRALPSAVHAAFRKRALIHLGYAEGTLTPDEEAVVARHPEYRQYADDMLERWQNLALYRIPAPPGLLRALIQVAEMGQQVPSRLLPFFLNPPERIVVKEVKT